MPDWTDPYAAAATNPYMGMSLPQAQPMDKWTMIGNMLLGAGAGISAGDANGRWTSGIGPGLLMGSQLVAQQQQKAEADALKRWQLGMMAAEYNDKHQDRLMKRQALQAAADEYAPRMNVPPPAGGMGPGSYDDRTASLEGGKKNGGMVFNELGSGAFGPFQFMPSTWADVRAKNPDLNLPADMTQATRDQHVAAAQRFKAANAQALTAAGFQPTPDNLYLAHRFGAGGATSVLRADPNAMLSDVLPIDWQRQNPDMRGQTVGGFRRLAGERMKGVGQPYEVPPNAQPTQYALQPNALPAFDDSTLSLLPRPSRLMPGTLPNADASPGFTAPVMPQPQAPMVTPAQYTPDQPPAAAPAATDAPPKLILPPKPELPAEVAVQLRRGLQSGTITPEQARTHADKVVNDLWNAQKDEAKARFQQESENYRHQRGQAAEESRFQRGQNAKDAWELIDPANAQMMLGPGYDSNKAYQRNKVTGDIKPVGGSLVNITNQAESETQKALIGSANKFHTEQQEASTHARTGLNQLNRLDTLLGQVGTGKFTGTTQDIKQTAKAFGIDLGALGVKDDTAPAQAADALSKSLALTLRDPSQGAGMPGSLSDSDRRFLASMVPTLETTPEGRKLMVEYARKMYQRQIDLAKMANSYVRSQDFAKDPAGIYAKLQEYADANPLFTEGDAAPAAAPPAPAAPAVRRYNPKTGRLE